MLRSSSPEARLFQEEEVVELTSEQLHWLMDVYDGYDVLALPHTSITFTHVI